MKKIRRTSIKQLKDLKKPINKNAVKKPVNIEPDTYRQPLAFVTDYNASIHKFSNQVNKANKHLYESSLLGAMTGIEKSLGNFHKINKFLPSFEKFSKISDALVLSRDITSRFAKLSGSGLAGNLAFIQSANKIQQNSKLFFSNFPELKNSFPDFRIEQPGKDLAKALGSANLRHLGIQSSFAHATALSLFAEKSLSAFKWADLGSAIGITAASRTIISRSFTDLSTGYAGLIKSYESKISSFADLAPSVSKIIPIEYYTGVNLLESISTEPIDIPEEKLVKDEIQYENEYSLNKYLPEISKGFLDMWKGAVQTFYSNNPDKVRQFTVSIRELYGHLMRMLAPDDKIHDWNESPQFYQDGKPTRAARLHYICRNISNKPFSKFVDKDIQATIEFINIFQEGTHSIQSNFTPAQLVALKCKAETTLKFLLEIEFSVNR